jgi:hypothetical protein
MFRLLTSIALCAATISASNSLAKADDWGQWLGSNRDSIWSETGIIKSIPEGGLKEVWRTPVANGFSGPAVVGDRVFITDFVPDGESEAFNPGQRHEPNGNERIHCLDRTGNQYHHRRASQFGPNPIHENTTCLTRSGLA